MIGQRCALTATVVLLLHATSLAMACEPMPIGKDAARIDGQNFVLVWRVEPAPLRLASTTTSPPRTEVPCGLRTTSASSSSRILDQATSSPAPGSANGRPNSEVGRKYWRP